VQPATFGYVSRVLEESLEGGVASRVAAELEALKDLVASHPRLAAVLSDVAVPGSAKEAIVRDLLSSRASPLTVAVAAHLAGTCSSDLTEALTRASERFSAPPATLELAGSRLVVEGFCSRQVARDRTSGYVHRLTDASSVKELEEGEDEVFRFVRTAEAHPALRRVLSDPMREPTAKCGLVAELLATRVSRLSLLAITYVFRAGRARDVVIAGDLIVRQLAGARGRRVALVRAAVELSQEDLSRIERLAGVIAGGQPEVRQVVDPSVLGGFVVEVGDYLVDRSLARQLSEMRERVLEGGRDGRAAG
jgi:F-type H+-transporting ATPase subunit delta